jgi:hypothetical protein
MRVTLSYLAIGYTVISLFSLKLNIFPFSTSFDVFYTFCVEKVRIETKRENI